MKTRTVSIMQPYFIPYAGYFRLFAASDIFVIYDCVQFNRRGWLHRNLLHDQSREHKWLTLPLQKSSRDVLIRDLSFRDSAAADFADESRRFSVFTSPELQQDRAACDLLTRFDVRPAVYIERLLEWAVTSLGLEWNVVRSSDLDIAPDIRGQDRIIAIASRLGASRYVNPSGGVDLYDKATFEAAGITLSFLSPYEGSTNSILERLLLEDRTRLIAEIHANTRLQD